MEYCINMSHTLLYYYEEIHIDYLGGGTHSIIQITVF